MTSTAEGDVGSANPNRQRFVLAAAVLLTVPGVVVRCIDGDTVPPLSDYDAFWKRGVPFVFLSCGRSRVYHTPEDTPDLLDYDKMAATAAWLAQFTRETCTRTEARIQARPDFRDDASTSRRDWSARSASSRQSTR